MRLVLLLAVLLGASVARADEPYRAVRDVLSATETVVGEPLGYPSGSSPRVHALIISLRPGEATAHHRHGVPLFAYLLQGELTVEYDGHGKRVYREGDALLEAMSVAHRGRNTGTTPVRILAVFLSASGAAETVADAAPASAAGGH